MWTVVLAASLAVAAAGCQTHKSRQPQPPPVPVWPHISVLGDFNNPGYCPWTNGMKLPDAIQMAGGFSPGADRILYLKHPEGAPQKFYLTIDYECTNDVLLESNDVITNPVQAW